MLKWRRRGLYRSAISIPSAVNEHINIGQVIPYRKNISGMWYPQVLYLIPSIRDSQQQLLTLDRPKNHLLGYFLRAFINCSEPLQFAQS